MIYFIELVDKGYIKIGHTTDVVNRMTSLKKQHGELKFLGHIEGDTTDESFLLRRFFKYSVRQKFWNNGRCPEIFHPHEKLLGFISSKVDKSLCKAVEDEIKRRKGPIRRGRLPDHEVLEIRQKHKRGVSIKDIAIDYKRSEASIRTAINGYSYQHLKGKP